MRLIAWIGTALLAVGAQAAQAQPTRIALVLGNATYAEGGRLAAVPGCAPAARQVSAALRDLGFKVTERINVGRGAADVAIAGFARDLRATPGAAGIAYVCGQMANLGDRAFLLPASAAMERAGDVVSEGLIVRQLPDAMLRAQVSAGLVVLDGFVPSRPAAQPLTAALAPVAEAAAAGGVGFAASLAEPRPDSTPLAAALAAVLAGPQVRLGEAMAGLRAQLPPGSLVSLAVPSNPGFLAGEPPAPAAAAPAPVPTPAPLPSPAPAPPAAVPAPPAATAPAPPTAAPAPPAATAPAPPAATAPAPPAATAPAPPAATAPPQPAAPEAITMPDEAAMTDADRRRVQQALTRLGYYSGQADGVFGPNTRAAIRRYQFEIGAEMTGNLTAAQASRLVRQ